MSVLSREIVKRRKRMGLSLREVAKRTKLSYQAILNTERGVAKLETAARIAHALGMSKRSAVDCALKDVFAA